MDTFFLVWNPKGGNPTKRHENQREAMKEAERLCRENPNDEFYVLEAKGVYAAKPVVRPEWIMAIELPF